MPPPMVSPTLSQASLAGSQGSKAKNKIHVSFTDWVLGGSLLSINSSPNALAATRARSDSRIRATASKDKKGRNIVILEDRDQDGLVGGEVEMLVVRKVGRKGSGSRSRSASGASNITVKAKVVDEVMETVVEEKTAQEEKKEEKKEEREESNKVEEVEEKKVEEKVEEKVEVKKEEGEHKSDLQKEEEEAKKTEEKAVEQEPKAEEPTADVVPETAAVIVIEDKDKKIQPEVVIVEVKVREKEKDKDKGKDKDAKQASKASKEKTDSKSEKPAEVKESDKEGKIEPVNRGEWTQEQDDRLMTMKKENKTWKDIVGRLGTSKKDAVARYKILQAKEKEEEKPKKPEKKKQNNNNNNIKCTTQADKNEGSEDDFYIAPDCPYHHPKSKSSSSKSGKKEKKRKSYGELDRNRDDEEDEEERARESRNGKGHLRPDHIWSAEDCETLEYLMEKHTSTQWLQLQAGFFNYTGRMIKAEFIERKFRKDGLA
ncbi:hypothetical protein MFRU_003g02670 [Monilinia fructicola]|nr:hypothetical protein MFRU_003g02670 [Monilinia fructicola]